MSALRVYRIVVESWPTPDGQPWARLYGPKYAGGGREDDVVQPEVPDWLFAIVNTAHGPEAWRVQTRCDYIPEDQDDSLSVVMPKPKRKHYLSASGTSELAANMRAFGAVVRVEQSKAVEW